MRENKYKVWCKNNNEWEKDKMMFFCDGSLAQLKNGLIIPCKQETHIIVFYTGLLDKNSKEIYEGDILKRYVDYDEDDKHEEIGYVGYRDCCYVLEERRNVKEKDIEKTVQYIEWSSEFFENCEVIGNIYSNPELLK